MNESLPPRSPFFELPRALGRRVSAPHAAGDLCSLMRLGTLERRREDNER